MADVLVMCACAICEQEEKIAGHRAATTSGATRYPMGRVVSVKPARRHAYHLRARLVSGLSTLSGAPKVEALEYLEGGEDDHF